MHTLQVVEVDADPVISFYNGPARYQSRLGRVC
jgi:hypothetical protein